MGALGRGGLGQTTYRRRHIRSQLSPSIGQLHLSFANCGDRKINSQIGEPHVSDTESQFKPFPSFSAWTRWEDREQLEHSDEAGVYLLSRHDGNPPAFAAPSDESVICIAETHGQSLIKRWDQFEYCAFRQGRGHSEGCAFSRINFAGEKGDIPAWLYVSAAPLDRKTPDIRDLTGTCKRKLLQEYQRVHGRLPACNTNI